MQSPINASNSEISHVTLRRKFAASNIDRKITPTKNCMTTTTGSISRCETNSMQKGETNEDTDHQNDKFYTPPASQSPQYASTQVANLKIPEETININVPTNNTFSLLSDDDGGDTETQVQHIICTLHRSCPELNTLNLSNTEDMKDMIRKLKSDLDSAHKEVELLRSTN